MQDLRNIDVPKITDGERFEYLCRDLWRNYTNYEFVELNGRKGQRQFGVDVFGRDTETSAWFGIQCKVKAKGDSLKKSEIEAEINKAKLFNPTISKFLICTTLDRDTNVQCVVRQIQSKLSRNTSFNIEVVFWDEIAERLKEEGNINIYYKYYQNYFADNTTFGHSIGKLFNLELGCGAKLDSHYELMLGKIPNYKDCKHSSVNYYRGTYFVINFHQNSIETFTWPCFESDVVSAFPNDYDRFRIVKWLSAIANVDDFIFSDEFNYEFFVTREERDRHYLDLLE